MNYGIIGNCKSGALVDDQGSIVWLCLPYFDSPSIFASILDTKKGGSFGISPKNLQTTKQHYFPKTAILRTTFITKDGIFEVNDYMPRYEVFGSDPDCPAEIQRYIRVLRGSPITKFTFTPCPNYGLAPAKCQTHSKYIKITSQKGHYESFYLYTNLHQNDVLDEKEIILPTESYFLLSYHQKISPPSQEYIHLNYTKTKIYWIEWSNKTKLPTNYKDLVLRSAITLKLLSFQETGAVIAALTTSLPEIIGGERNWDYRYCWPRDSAMIIDICTHIGHTRQAKRFMRFILQILKSKSDEAQIMYSIHGEKNLEEKTLDHLSGYEDSAPVRIGNGAYNQQQHDIYGELIDIIYTYFICVPQERQQIDEEIWTVVRSLVRLNENVWQEPDNGIWEFRGKKRHFLFSKLLSWVAFDRASKLATIFGHKELNSKWRAQANVIKNDIMEKGWNEKIGSFTQYYGGTDLDASTLLMLHYGFLPADDEKMRKTVLKTYADLTVDQFTFRYLSQDDFGKPKNSFIVCTFWMIEALWAIGESEKALSMFDNITKYTNHLGLLSEDIEIESKRLTGNFPQGYSHLALIRTALLLENDSFRSHVFSTHVQRAASSDE
ncbi:glycoside hydrolase family 15 protein [Bacteriovoracaceae bacterium]|nr:glycoside hydrolase family 15 protein [Bacteriovoracaceae bacterium]